MTVIFALDGKGSGAECQRWRLDEEEATRFFMISSPLDRSASPPSTPGGWLRRAGARGSS